LSLRVTQSGDMNHVASVRQTQYPYLNADAVSQYAKRVASIED